ncbi:MAG: hypothetical protein RRY29_08880 [Desulfovibrionaceae bacterium]
MKKICIVWMCLVLFGMGVTSAVAVETSKAPVAKPVIQESNPIEQLTGDIWLNSTNDVKKALLFGVDCAVSIEQAVAKRFQELDKDTKKKIAAMSTLSPFEQGWAQAFQGVPRGEIVESIDTWYAQNPDKQQRPVFEVIWYELIMPKNK